MRLMAWLACAVYAHPTCVCPSSLTAPYCIRCVHDRPAGVEAHPGGEECQEAKTGRGVAADGLIIQWKVNGCVRGVTVKMHHVCVL